MRLPHIIINNTHTHTHTHARIALREHAAQHPPLANNDTQAQRGKWINFLKVQLDGMGGDEERIWCLFHQHVRGMENTASFC